MGFLTKKEVIAKTGKDATFINRYAKRGHLIFSVNESGQSLLDDTFPLNSAFLEKWKKKDTDEVIVTNTSNVPKTAPNVKTIKQKPAETGSIKMDPQKVAAYDLAQQTKAIELEKVQLEVEQLKFKNAKLHGEIIPVELVTNIFSQHTKAVVTEYRNSLDKMITQIAGLHKLTNAEIANLKAIVNKEINQAGERSLMESLKNIENIQAGYSLRKGRGERI